MTPYVTEGVERYTDRNLENVISYFTARGFAVAQGDVRGTGESGGCLEQTSTNQIDDGARFVEYLGKDAPWSNGSVGMYGISYDGETQISTAGLGDPADVDGVAGPLERDDQVAVGISGGGHERDEPAVGDGHRLPNLLACRGVADGHQRRIVEGAGRGSVDDDARHPVTAVTGDGDVERSGWDRQLDHALPGERR